MKKFTAIILSVIMLIPLSFTASALLKGDADADYKLTAADARLVLRVSVNLGHLREQQEFFAADVNGNRRIEADDARIILRSSVGIENVYERYYCSSMEITSGETTEKLYLRPDGQHIKYENDEISMEYKYDACGMISSIEYSSGIIRTFEEKKLKDGNILKRCSVKTNGGKYENIMDCVYNRNHRLIYINDYEGNTNYIYDSDGRVIREFVFDGSDGSLMYEYRFLYYSHETMNYSNAVIDYTKGKNPDISKKISYFNTDRRVYFEENYKNGKITSYSKCVDKYDNKNDCFENFLPDGTPEYTGRTLRTYDGNGNAASIKTYGPDNNLINSCTYTYEKF